MLVYYKQIRFIIKCINAKNKLETKILLLLLEIVFFDNIIKLSVKNISNFDIKKEAVRKLSLSIKLFYLIYSITKKVKQIKVKVTKFADSKAKNKQL